MRSLAVVAEFAKRVGVVPPVPPTQSTGGTVGGTDKGEQYQCDSNFVPPVPPVPPQNNDDWDENDRWHAYEERAAIMEFDGGLARHEAEALAWLEVFGDRDRNSVNSR